MNITYVSRDFLWLLLKVCASKIKKNQQISIGNAAKIRISFLSAKVLSRYGAWSMLSVLGDCLAPRERAAKPCLIPATFATQSVSNRWRSQRIHVLRQALHRPLCYLEHHRLDQTKTRRGRLLYLSVDYFEDSISGQAFDLHSYKFSVKASEEQIKDQLEVSVACLKDAEYFATDRS